MKNKTILLCTSLVLLLYLSGCDTTETNEDIGASGDIGEIE